jgi:hypothetical protein
LETAGFRGTLLAMATAAMKTITLEQARAAKDAAEELFRAVAPVVGVGITKIAGGYGLKVNLSDQPAKGSHVATEVRGVPVRVEVVGPIKKRTAAR